MKLDLGGHETIDSPSADDVRHYLKYMPAESPFVILSHETAFIQARHTGMNYRVEYCVDDGHEHYYCLVDYQTACDLFLDFHAERMNYQTSVEWKRFRLGWSIAPRPNHGLTPLRDYFDDLLHKRVANVPIVNWRLSMRRAAFEQMKISQLALKKRHSNRVARSTGIIAYPARRQAALSARSSRGRALFHHRGRVTSNHRIRP